MRFAPPTSADLVGLLLDRITSQARCKAAMELEHALSQVTEGPFKLLPIVITLLICTRRIWYYTYKNQLMRLERIESAVPVLAYLGMACISLDTICL